MHKHFIDNDYFIQLLIDDNNLRFKRDDNPKSVDELDDYTYRTHSELFLTASLNYNFSLSDNEKLIVDYLINKNTNIKHILSYVNADDFNLNKYKLKAFSINTDLMLDITENTLNYSKLCRAFAILDLLIDSSKYTHASINEKREIDFTKYYSVSLFSLLSKGFVGKNILLKYFIESDKIKNDIKLAVDKASIFNKIVLNVSRDKKRDLANQVIDSDISENETLKMYSVFISEYKGLFGLEPFLKLAISNNQSLSKKNFENFDIVAEYVTKNHMPALCSHNINQDDVHLLNMLYKVTSTRLFAHPMENFLTFATQERVSRQEIIKDYLTQKNIELASGTSQLFNEVYYSFNPVLNDNVNILNLSDYILKYPDLLTEIGSYDIRTTSEMTEIYEKLKSHLDRKIISDDLAERIMPAQNKKIRL